MITAYVFSGAYHVKSTTKMFILGETSKKKEVKPVGTETLVKLFP